MDVFGSVDEALDALRSQTIYKLRAQPSHERDQHSAFDLRCSDRMSVLRAIAFPVPCHFQNLYPRVAMIHLRESGLSGDVSVLDHRWHEPSCASLALELVALRHQVIALRRERPAV
jgi:hypothetical protein